MSYATANRSIERTSSGALAASAAAMHVEH
jgi:hypothetical protein